MSQAPPEGVRCARAALERGDVLAGTASTVRSFLLVENAGPWGRDALADARLPDGLGAELKARAARAGVRPLLVRRGVRSGTDEGIRAYLATARPGRVSLTTAQLASYHQLLDLDLAAAGRGEPPPGWRAQQGPLFATCTHGRHDVCCAERGRPVAARVRELAGTSAWEVSHLGGDRFAGNLLVLPWGFYYGGLGADNVAEVVEAHRRDRVHLPLLRGRSAYPMPVQYAEVALRTRLGESRLGAVVAQSWRREGSVTRALLRHGQDRWVVAVETRPGPAARLTCTARRDNPIPVHTLLSADRAVGASS